LDSALAEVILALFTLGQLQRLEVNQAECLLAAAEEILPVYPLFLSAAALVVEQEEILDQMELLQAVNQMEYLAQLEAEEAERF
jgi:hypothetical protein